MDYDNPSVSLNIEQWATFTIISITLLENWRDSGVEILQRDYENLLSDIFGLAPGRVVEISNDFLNSFPGMEWTEKANQLRELRLRLQQDIH